MDFSEIIVTKVADVMKTYINQGQRLNHEKRKFSGIIIPLKGRFEFIFSDNSYIVDSTHPIFIPKGATYHFVCKEYAESIVINFQTYQEDFETKSLPPIDGEVADNYFKQLFRLFSAITPQHHAIFSLLYSFFQELFSGNIQDKSELLVLRAEKIMEKNFADADFSVQDVAKELNISEVYLRKLFVKNRGIPVGKYLIKLRIEKGKLLLLHGISVGEAAVLSGYCDIYQFSRAFKNHFGYPPSSLHKKMPLI